MCRRVGRLWPRHSSNRPALPRRRWPARRRGRSHAAAAPIRTPSSRPYWVINEFVCFRRGANQARAARAPADVAGGAAPRSGASVQPPQRATTLLSCPLEDTPPSASAQDEGYAGTDRRQRQHRPRPFGDGNAPHRTIERSTRSHAPAQGRQPPATTRAGRTLRDASSNPSACASQYSSTSFAETRSAAHGRTKTRSRSTPQPTR